MQINSVQGSDIRTPEYKLVPPHKKHWLSLWKENITNFSLIAILQCLVQWLCSVGAVCTKHCTKHCRNRHILVIHQKNYGFFAVFLENCWKITVILVEYLRDLWFHKKMCGKCWGCATNPVISVINVWVPPPTRLFLVIIQNIVWQWRYFGNKKKYDEVGDQIQQ